MKLKIMLMALLLLAGIGSAVNWLPESTMAPGADLSMYEGDPGNIEMWGGNLNNVSFVLLNNASANEWIFVGDDPDCMFLPSNLQAALDVAEIGTQKVYIKPGMWNIEPVTIPSNVTLSGAGEMTTTLLITNETSPAFTIKSFVRLENLGIYYPNQNVTASGVPIEYPPTIQTSSSGSVECSIRNLHVHNAYDFLVIDQWHGHHYINNIVGAAYHNFINVSDTSGNAIFRDIAVIPTTEWQHGADRYGDRYWIANNATAFVIANITGGVIIDNCEIWAVGAGVNASNARGIRIINSAFDCVTSPIVFDSVSETWINKVYINTQTYTTWNETAAISTWGTDDTGIKMTDCVGISISDNKVYSGLDGIYVAGGSYDINIHGNIIKSSVSGATEGAGVFLEITSHNIIIDTNTFDGTDRAYISKGVAFWSNTTTCTNNKFLNYDYPIGVGLGAENYVITLNHVYSCNSGLSDGGGDVTKYVDNAVVINA